MSTEEKNINKIDEEKLRAAKEELACKILPPGSHGSSGKSTRSDDEIDPSKAILPDGTVKLTQMTTAGG